MLSDLLTTWRARAEELEAYAEPAAAAFRRAADELEAALQTEDQEPLTLEAASALSGYSTSHLRRMIADGTLPNAGKPRSPRVLRVHLPRKPGYGVATPAPTELTSRSQVARAVASGE